MKILHVLNHTTKSNGHVHAAVDLACEQAATGHRVTIASEGGDFDALLTRHHVAVEYLGHRRKLHKLPVEMLSFFRLFRRLRPDVVHAHMMTSAVLAWLPCQVLRIPLVTTVHNEFEKSAILMGLGKRVIAVSESVRNSMERRGISRKRLRVVLNGTIGSARMENPDPQPVTLKKPNVMFVGGLHPRKGLVDLFDAFEIAHRTHKDATLYIVGAGPFEDEYKAYVSRLDCAAAVSFLGTVAKPLPYLSSADIFVLPSHADPAPLVISEAREAGCAVIGTSVDGIPQLLNFGEAGILVPPKNPGELARAISDLLADKDTLATWRSRSQDKIDFLKIARVSRDTLEVYRSAATNT